MSSHVAVAAIYYVDKDHVSPNCANSGAGTEAAPWCTVAYGVSHMSGGATLYIKQSVAPYDGNITIIPPSGTAAQHTVIAAYPGHVPILAGTGYSGRFKVTGGCAYVDLTGLTIHTLQQGLYLETDEGTQPACTYVTVTRFKIYNIGQQGVTVRSGTSATPRNIIIQDSEVYDTGKSGSANGEGFYIGNSSGTDLTNDVIIRNNYIHDVVDEGIELKRDTKNILIEGNTLVNCMIGSTFGSTAGVIETNANVNTSTNPFHIIRNNIIHTVATGGGWVRRGIRIQVGASVYNNILYNIGTGNNCIRVEGNAWPSVVYHNTLDCTTGNAVVHSGGTAPTVSNNIGPSTTNNIAFSSVFFVNAASLDYRLVVGAAPINVGVDLTSVVPKDIAGRSRLVMSPPDLGAYEYDNGDIQPPAAPTGLRVL
jgi:hypothetical protein